jgi:hypothetical protein
MARKPIPKKAKRNKEVEKQVEIFKRATQARYDLARQAFDEQDDDTQEVITRIQKMLCVNANGIVRVWLKGDKRREASVTVTVDMDYVEMNAFYMAIEILKDLAMMDVRIANFKFPESFCAECGVKLNDRGKGKKKRKVVKAKR